MSRELGEHYYQPGDVIGRWTVVRHASPVTREVRRGHVIRQHRVHVRCACGVRRDVEERRLRHGLSGGCASKACMHVAALVAECRELEAVREAARRQEREASERLAAIVEKLDRVRSRLPGESERTGLRG